MRLRLSLGALRGNDALKDVLRLLSGTVGGRLIAIAAMPIVTRLYSPHDFALLAVYLGLVNLGVVIGCMRLDVAIPVAQSEDDAAHLLALSLIAALVISTTMLLAVVIAPHRLALLLGQPDLAPWTWLIPLGILMGASYSALQFWATRARRFTSVAITRVTQAATGVGAMLGLGWLGVAPLGLLLGNMLSTSAGSIRLARETFRNDRAKLERVTKRGLSTAFGRYRRFPVYSMPEALANIAGIQIPIMIVAAYAGPVAGFLLLAQQIMAAPMALLGSSISQVYISRAPQEMREGRLDGFTLGVLYRLLQTGVPAILLIGVAAPIAFSIFFSKEWSSTAEIIAWMVPWMALQFLASPISMVMFVVEKQRKMLSLTLFGGALRIGAVVAAMNLPNQPMVAAFLTSSALFYGVCLCVFSSSAGIKPNSRSLKFAGLTILVLGGYLFYQIAARPWVFAGGGF